ncbi:MAG: PDZ domain-containing protein [Acidobacteria bacterium]|nr:PDZ domain-containing protein [Acidobacteriota bacterium]
MVPLSPRLAAWIVLAAWLGGPASAALAQDAPAEVAAPAAGEDGAALIAAAQAAFDETEFEKSLELANRARAALAPLLETASGDGELALRQQVAHALDLVAQSQLNLDQRAAAAETVETLVRAWPAFTPDPKITGPTYAKLVDGKRKALVGQLELTCVPLACERVLVDGRLAAAGPAGAVPLLAGTHQVVGSRRNFTDAVLPDVQVAAGQTVQARAELQQVSRDLVLTTEPAGVSVSFDHRPLGATEPGDGAASKPFLIAEVPPGPHTLVLEAPCRRRVEQVVEVVLDAADPGPQDVGTRRLEAARASVDLRWSRPEGIFALDGQPVKPGKVEACPGPHELSLTLGGRRAWFTRVDLAEDDVVSVTPAPRPTVALIEGQQLELPGFPGAAWNTVTVSRAAGDDLLARLAARFPGGPAQLFPRIVRAAPARVGEAARAAAPEADVLVAALPGGDPVLDARRVVVLDIARDLAEVVAYLARDTEAPRAVAAQLVTAPALFVPYLGLDVAGRAARAPVVAAVVPGSPAAGAGIAPGAELLALNGAPLDGARALDSGLRALPPGVALKLTVRPGGEPREVELTPLAVVDAPLPAVLDRGLLLGQLAWLTVVRAAGEPKERMAAGPRFALTLAALGRNEEAAGALDLASVDAENDPAQDARATVLWVQERLLRALGRAAYADEVRARGAAMATEGARLGGRNGPPLRFAPESPD